LQWPNTPKERLRELQTGCTFVITCREFKVLFQEKENKNKEEELAKVERNKERKKNLKITAGKSSIEKANDKRGMCFNCNKSVKTDIPGVFIMQQTFP
jgi:ribosomal protein L44E